MASTSRCRVKVNNITKINRGSMTKYPASQTHMPLKVRTRILYMVNKMRIIEPQVQVQMMNNNTRKDSRVTITIHHRLIYDRWEDRASKMKSNRRIRVIIMKMTIKMMSQIEIN